MKSKRQQILKLCEFNANYINNIMISLTSENASESEIAMANEENARLLPIITALLNRVEQLEGALEWIETANSLRIADIWNDHKQEPYEYLSTQISEAISSVSKPTALDALLKGDG